MTLSQDVVPMRYTEEQRKTRARWHVKEVLQTYFGFPAQPFHVEFLELCFKGGKYVVNWPTDHGKSIMGTFFFPILSLMNDPEESHIICGASLNDAKRRVQAIQRELETNQMLQRDYPWVGKPESSDSKSWSTMELTVAGRTINKPNPSIRAVGAGATDIRGRRGKLILDDVEGPEHRESPTRRRQLFDFVMEEGLRCYEAKHDSKRPLVALIGTPWDLDSIYFKLDKWGFQPLRRSVLVSPRPALKASFERGERARIDTTNPQEWKLLWEVQREKVEAQWRGMTKQHFSVNYLMDPSGGDPNQLSYEELKQLAEGADFDMPSVSRTFVTLDPAAGLGGKSDYAGIAVVRIIWNAGEELPLVDILECHAFQQGLFEQVHFVTQLAWKYGEEGQPLGVIYESNGQQGGTYWNAFTHLHPEIRLTPTYSGPNWKFDTQMGLTMLKSLFRQQRLRIPASQLDSDGVDHLLWEIRDLGQPRAHDHIASAIWFVVRYMYNQVRHYNGPKLVSGYQPRRPFYSGTPYQGPRFGLPVRTR